MLSFSRQLFKFGFQQALSCIFPGFIFLTLGITKYLGSPLIPRYDFILLVCIILQVLMLVTKLETKDELKVITLFHLIGLALEIYKTKMGSWAYPEFAYSKVFGVPLYSGFMYASVASYICQAWRRFNLSLSNWPPSLLAFLFSLGVYLNFFSHHFIPDLRWILIALLFILFFKTWVSFTVNHETYRMPMTLSFFLIAFFIWIAENISTFLGAWNYPDQMGGWKLVHLGKLSSWFLLVVISIIIVAQLKHVKEELYSDEEDFADDDFFQAS
ncbi:hypothetical protein CH373_11095 [Leptospira perolatii]|uniref:DUF817 domain-containing protein n=1 Tax=Leptospira perolatii TaxID=2023191 RepID=A0A2M9ZM38_9LEPT|nr:hypothetical protein CH360_09140 [Leptospira perolatii]PJZ73168.1 hypothetical protein CH373_11095 [Leptospira perolatii]